MHDEENEIGINVRNKRGDVWSMYGDQKSLGKAGERNKEICKAAV